MIGIKGFFFLTKAGIWIGICGELGADISMLPTFLAMGIDELSVSPLCRAACSCSHPPEHCSNLHAGDAGVLMHA